MLYLGGGPNALNALNALNAPKGLKAFNAVAIFFKFFPKNLFLFQKLCNFAKLTMMILRNSKVKQI